MQPSAARDIKTRPIPTWQEQMRLCVTSAQELLGLLSLKSGDVGLSDAAEKDFPVKVPLSFVRRMNKGDPNDPLLLQVLASPQEEDIFSGYSHDPVGEAGAANPIPGVLHKYHGRALLIASGGCAVHCRYCFRRHFPYETNRNAQSEWREAITYIARDSSIDEVILSGGDPLIMTDKSLTALIDQIAAVPHVKRLRIHSRLPIVLPDRVTTTMLGAVKRPNLQTIIVVHCNHENEIDAEVQRAFDAIRAHNITLLNQTVLLANVNDTEAAQIALNKKLFAAGALPYYLHLLDKVQGAAHFDIPEEEALALHLKMRAQLPGYMVPKLVREEAGEKSKTLMHN
ncbi:MAG: EF-P beta-lysylation protein EpmB [Pseudomonadales bacterium]